MRFKGTDENDDLTGTKNADLFRMDQNGNDTVNGGRGDDVFDFGESWSSGDKVIGGDGFDTVRLSGGGTLLIGTSGLRSVETVSLADNGDYNITLLNAGNVHEFVTFDGSGLGKTHELRVDAGNETTRAFSLRGGAASDHLTGGQGADQLIGNLGADYIDGEGGHDTIVYTGVEQSTSTHFDHVTFDFHSDFFAFGGVTDVDKAFHKRLDGDSTASFNHHLEKVVDGGHLKAHHAVVFEASLGDWSGHTFLIVDANGQAGYQTGADYVVELIGDHLQQIDIGNFVDPN